MPNVPVLERSILEVGLSNATRHALWHSGLTTVGAVAGLTAEEIRSLPRQKNYRVGIGDRRIEEIRVALNRLGLALKGELVEFVSEYELDQVATALIQAGTPGIIAKPSNDGNGFLLQLSKDGQQLELRRAPAQSKWDARKLIEALRDKGKTPIYDPELAEQICWDYGWELNGRPRIKSVITFSTLASGGEGFRLLEVELFNGAPSDWVELDLDGFVFTGKHWILVANSR